MSNSWDFGGDAGAPGTRDSWSDLSAPTTPPATSSSQEGSSGDPLRTPAPAGGASASAPVLWLVFGIVLALFAITASVVTTSLTAAIGGWVLGGPAAIGLLAVFVNSDNNARANPWYAESAVAAWSRRALVLLALLAVGLNAWGIADYIARGRL